MSPPRRQPSFGLLGKAAQGAFQRIQRHGDQHQGAADDLEILRSRPMMLMAVTYRLAKWLSIRFAAMLTVLS